MRQIAIAAQRSTDAGATSEFHTEVKQRSMGPMRPSNWHYQTNFLSLLALVISTLTVTGSPASGQVAGSAKYFPVFLQGDDHEWTKLAVIGIVTMRLLSFRAVCSYINQ